jgi:hypothetical protein
MIDPELGLGVHDEGGHHHHRNHDQPCGALGGSHHDDDEEDDGDDRRGKERLFDIDLSAQGLKPDDCAFIARMLSQPSLSSSSSSSCYYPMLDGDDDDAVAGGGGGLHDDHEDEEDEEMGLFPPCSSSNTLAPEPYCRLLEFFPLLEVLCCSIP